MNIDKAIKTKLTLITVNGKTVMAQMPTDENGKVRADLRAVLDAMGIPEDRSIWQFGFLPSYYLR